MLSICIPTRNRYPYLVYTLDQLKRDFPHAEIVISDNASTDFSREDVTYLRADRCISHQTDIGAFANMLEAFQAATGDYAVYCADDDYLLPDQVAAGIAYLDAHPEVAAYCAPCEIWDEVNQKPYWNAFKVPKPVTFTKGVEIFNFLIEYHAWPEHIIYRTPVPLKPRTRAYWAFADIPDILERGAMHFSPTPFYRNLLTHPVGMRTQLGNEQCLTHFDEYRAGLEVLAQGLFGDGLPYTVRHQIQDMIQSFICQRLDVARRLHLQAGNEEEAQMIVKRLSIASPVRDVTI